MKNDYYEKVLRSMFFGDVPESIIKAGKTFIDIKFSSVLNTTSVQRVTVKDVVYYYYKDARNITSGCRSLAGMVGDWRQINELAEICFEYFKQVNRSALEKEGKKYRMTLK